MPQALGKEAVQQYQKHRGNFRTSTITPLRREMDLENFYYPGILQVLEKMRQSPETSHRYSRHQETMAVIGTGSALSYPLLVARSALLSDVAGINAFPLLVQYDHPRDLPDILRSLSPSFRALYCADLRPFEKDILKSGHRIEIPLLFSDEMEAAAVLAGIRNVMKMLRSSPKKLKIVLEGTDMLLLEIVRSLKSEHYEHLTFLDLRGAIYPRRKNLNHSKIMITNLLNASKDARTREEILAQADVYISSQPEDLTSQTTNLLPDRAVIVSLKAPHIQKKPHQSIISSLPSQNNHLTDLHITAGIFASLAEGKAFTAKSVNQAINGLSSIFSSPKPRTLIPGLLEKNLAKKIAKGIK